MLSFRARALAAAQLSPPVRRILAHSLLLGLAMSVADLLFNFYLISLGYAADTAGLLSTIYRFAGVVVGLPVGLLIDRIGAQRALLIGALIYGGGWAVQLLMTELWALAITQAVVGAASILALTAVVPLLTGVTDEQRRTSIFGLNAAAALVIGLAGSAVGGLLPGLVAPLVRAGPQDTLAYRVALSSVVALALAAALPIIGAFPGAERGQPSGDAPPEAARASALTLLRYALPSLLMGIGGGALLPFLNLFFRQQFGLSDAVVGGVLAWGALGQGIGALLGAPFAARLGLKRAAALLRLCSAPAMLLMLVPALAPAVAGAFLRGLFIAASYPLNDAFVMQAIPPRQRGAAVSLMSVLWSLGWAGAALLSGWSQLRFGFGPALIAAAAGYALSALALLTMEPRPAQADA